MKSILSVLSVAFVLSSATAAEKKHNPSDHTHEKRDAGPNGGRIIATVHPRAEFFVTADRKVQITFLDAAGQAIAPAEQVVTVTTGDRSAPTKLTFAKTGNTLLSTAALPAGNCRPPPRAGRGRSLPGALHPRGVGPGPGGGAADRRPLVGRSG